MLARFADVAYRDTYQYADDPASIGAVALFLLFIALVALVK